MIDLPDEEMPHPGVVLKELYLEAKGWTQADLANKIGCPVQKVHELVTGKSDISADFAIDLAEALGTTPQLWTHMQSDYALFVALKKREQA